MGDTELDRIAGRALAKVPRFVSPQDLVVEYGVGGSALDLLFVAHYARGADAVFPPESLDTYWDSSDASPVRTCTWADGGGDNSAVTALMRRLAGPRQLVASPVPPMSSATKADDNPHAWSPDLLRHHFPHTFDRAVNDEIAKESGRRPLSRSEARAAARRQAALSEHGDSTSRPRLIITRENGHTHILSF